MKTITVKLTKNQIFSLKSKLSHFKIRHDIAYTYFQLKNDDVTITAYTSGKVVFSGLGAETYAAQFGYDPKAINQQPAKNPTIQPAQLDDEPLDMAGSDEVGTGDYFGPITVCACIVRKDDYSHIPVKRIKDSKQLTDDVIREIAPILMEHLEYSVLVLDNKKYNMLHETMNINVIKAKLHNQAFLNLKKRTMLPELCIIDQFVQESTYYRYLAHEPEIFNSLVFETKAENKYLAVACGAIIARYKFLEYYDKLDALYATQFPKGAGPHVDAFAIAFVSEHGPDALRSVSKYHFANTKRILNAL